MRLCWDQVQLQLESILQGHLDWKEELLGDSKPVIQDSLAGIWHCVRVLALFVLWKLHCKNVFENEVIFSVVFHQLWKEEVCMQLLAKGSFLIKDAKLSDYATYSDFIVVLVVSRKRM
jgi:hypothetical protein